MGKETDIKIKYRYGNIPEGLRALLDKADDSDMRVLTALLMLVDKETGATSLDAICDALSMDMGDVKASIKLWKGAGIAEDYTSETRDATVKAKNKLTTAHRSGAVEQSGTTDNYSSGELADIMESRIVSPALIDEAQRIMGKIFRTYDIGILVSIVERLGFEEEAVLLILNYTVSKGKRTMRYAETLAMAFYDEGITDVSEISERITRMEHSAEVIGQIKGFYGIGERALTASEKRFFTAWTEKYAYDAEVIKLAYDITVDNTQKPVPKYTNAILERWYSEGLRSAEEIKRYIERQSEERSGGAVVKSYDTDDFFEAALQRSYEELK